MAMKAFRGFLVVLDPVGLILDVECLRHIIL